MTAKDPIKLVGPVARICELVRYLAEQEGETTVTVIGRDLSLPISTVHRLLHQLMEQGFVERGTRYQSYRVGNELYRVGNLIARKMPLGDIALPFMEEIVAATGEFAMLCLYLPTERSVTIIRTVASPNPLTYRADTFVHLLLEWGASGRAILAQLPNAVIADIHGAANPSPVSGEVLPPLAEFRAELEQIRRDGFACTHGQKVADAVGLASPVFGSAGKVVASLCLTIPSFRFDPRRQLEIGKLLAAKAASISYASGYSNNLLYKRVC